MRGRTIKFPDKLWERVHEAAAKEGIGASQYIRDATQARIISENPAYRVVLEELRKQQS